MAIFNPKQSIPAKNPFNLKPIDKGTPIQTDAIGGSHSIIALLPLSFPQGCVLCYLIFVDKNPQQSSSPDWH